MAENKKSFVAYCDWEATFELLDNEEAGKLIKHLLAYVNDKNPELEERILKLAFAPIMLQLKRDLQKWDGILVKRVDAGKMGGIKSGEIRKNKANEALASMTNQIEANEAVNVNDNVTVNVNVKLDDLLSFFDFDYQNSKHINQARLGLAFLNHLTKQNQIEYFFNQFAAYKQIKTKEPTYKHSLKTFIGSQENCFNDGKWMDVNWVEKSKVKPEAEVVYFSQAEKNRAIRIASKEFN